MCFDRSSSFELMAGSRCLDRAIKPVILLQEFAGEAGVPLAAGPGADGVARDGIGLVWDRVPRGEEGGRAPSIGT